MELILILGYLALVIATFGIATAKGHSGCAFALFALFIPIISLIVVIIIKPAIRVRE